MKEESPKKNYIYQVAYQLLTILLPMITSPYIARVLGANGVGIYSYTYSIASYFVLAAKLGIHVYGNRSIAAVRDDQDKLNQTFSDLLFIHVGFSLVVLLVYMGYAALYPSTYRAIVWVQIFYVIGEMLEVDWLFFGLEKFRVTVVRNAAVKIFTLIAIFVFIHDEGDVWAYCAILAIGTALSQIVVWFFVPQSVRFVKPNVSSAPGHLRSLISLFIPSLAVSLYKVMDKIMLGALSSTVQVGFYENSEKIINITLGFVTALGTVMMPRMTNLIAKGDVKKSKQVIDTSMHFIMILTVAMAFGIAGVSKVFMPVFYGEEFASCYNLMTALAISMPFTAFANVLRTQFLLPNHHDHVFQGSVISGAVLNLIVNAALISSMGAMGAAIGTIAAEGIVCVIQAVFSRKYLPISKYIKDTVPFLLLGALMCGVVYLLGETMGESVVTLIVQILAGVVIYIGLAALYLWKTGDVLWQTVTGMVKQVLKR